MKLKNQNKEEINKHEFEVKTKRTKFIAQAER